MKKINMKYNFTYFSILALSITLCLIYFSYWFVGHNYNCLPALDFSIYYEAISRIAFFNEINPYVPIRGVKIFNDHVDPIILIAAPWLKLWNYNPFSLYFLEMFIPIGSLIILSRKLNYGIKEFSIGLFILLNCRALTGEWTYPLHPVTWLVPFLFLLAYYSYKNDLKKVVLLACLFLLIKEIFMFSLISFGAYLFIQKDKRKFSIPIFAIALIYISWFYGVRPSYDIINYSGRYFDRLKVGIINFLIDYFLNFDYKTPFFIFLPYLITLTIFWKKRWLEIKKFGSTIVFILPVLFIMLYTNIFFHWNSVPMTMTLFSVIFISKGFKEFANNKKIFIPVLFLFLIGNERNLTKVIKLGIRKKSNTCQISDARWVSLKKSRKIVKTFEPNSNILSTGGFIPMVQRPTLNFYKIGEYQNFKIKYDYIVVDRNNTGLHAPYSVERIEELILKCKNSKTIFNDDFTYIFKGPFSNDCRKMVL